MTNHPEGGGGGSVRLREAVGFLEVRFSEWLNSTDDNTYKQHTYVQYGVQGTQWHTSLVAYWLASHPNMHVKCTTFYI